jgi:superfamily II DNA or RNA helicase
MRDAVRELADTLLARASSTLLDRHLDKLNVADADAHTLISALHEAGVGDTLREVLGAGRLAQWVQDTCTASEEEALIRQLHRWLSGFEASADDPTRLATLRELPEDRKGILGWAEQYQVADELARPANEALGKVFPAPEGVTVLELCTGEAGGARTRSLIARPRGAEEARAHLWRVAALRNVRARREALWKREAPREHLKPLVERLRGLLSGTSPFTLEPYRFAADRPLTLDPHTGGARADFQARGDEPSATVSLELSGHEHRALEGRCTACTRRPCLHVLALAGRLLEACLDPDDRLHAQLLELTRVPSWRRFVDAIREPDAHEAPAQTVRFVLRIQGDLVSVGVLASKPGGGKGTLASPLKLLRAGAGDDADRAVLEALAQGRRTWGAQLVPADLTVLRSLLEHPRVVLDETHEPLRVSEQTLAVRFLEQPGGLLPKVMLAGSAVHAREYSSQSTFLLKHQAERGELVIAALTPPLRRLLGALQHFHGLLPEESFPHLAPLLVSLRRVADVEAPDALLGHEQGPIRKLLLRVTPGLDEGIDVVLTVRPLPLGAPFAPGQGPELVTGLVEGAPAYARRDLAWERDTAREVLARLELEKQARLEPFAYRIEEREQALTLLSRAARLTHVLDIEWAERARKLRITGTARTADLTVRLFKRGQWFTLEGHVRKGDKDIALERVLGAARRGERFVLVEGRDYLEIEQELFERLNQVDLGMSESEHKLALSLASLPYVLSKLGALAKAAEPDTAAWLERFARGDTPPPELDARFVPLLRKYQIEGVQFLLSRSMWASGVCLADEMGLGKTVQTIVLLAARAKLGPALVVAPTSLEENWRSEIVRFAPELTPHTYRGKGRRELLGELGEHSVVIVSYDLLLRDREHFQGVHFATQVVDEAQMVKNARTERAKAVLSVSADFRVALSGTPVENRLADLWSLFQLVAPNLLGGWSRFRARFAVPIERYENQERAEVLRALVAPFLLRRTKAEVAAELPARTEVVHMVELSPAEQDLYQSAVRHARKALGRRSRDDAQRNVQILAELTRLRQLACHPRLVLQDQRVESSKLHALLRLLDDILPRGHRALIFSQFTHHLALVREELHARGIASLSLDGSTPQGERARLVARFQAQECQVFLISLKAGGTGLNLTAADTVILMDPWWNPAAEDQAGVRAHRLGQERPVTVVKLVSQGTIEEKVLGLHGHKRRLADTVLAGESGTSPLDAETLEALLSA